MTTLVCTPGIATFWASARSILRNSVREPIRDRPQDVRAQFRLGESYDDGEGVEQDYEKALYWYGQAAGQGDATAQYRIGLMYDNGRGVAQDYAEAARWYRLAAAQGVADAQSNLGEMYCHGEGVRQDFIRAYMWFSVCADCGASGSAALSRDRLAARMTPQQVDAAQKLALECPRVRRKA
jgi:TPR repeat protein